MSNVDLLKEGYRNFATGNIDAVLATWNDDIVWEECTGFPYVEGDGVFVGPQNIVEGVLSQLAKYIDGFNIEISEFVDGGDTVVMVGYYTGTWKETGHKFRAHASHTWSFKNGKVSKFIQAVDSAEMMK